MLALFCSICLDLKGNKKILGEYENEHRLGCSILDETKTNMPIFAEQKRFCEHFREHHGEHFGAFPHTCTITAGLLCRAEAPIPRAPRARRGARR